MRTQVQFEYSIGDRVRIKAIDMIGQVDAMSQDVAGLQYRVVYWNDGTRHSTWMNDWELEEVKHG